MLGGPRLLTPEHLARVRACESSRKKRREIARSRARRSLGDITNTVSNIHERDPESLLHPLHCREIASTNNDGENIPCHGSLENEQTEEICMSVCEETSTADVVHVSPIVFVEGALNKVDRECLSIRRAYYLQSSLIVPSCLPLYFGKCLLHSLGDFTYVCSYCGASSWKSEAKSIRNFVGKFCCSLGKVKLLPLGNAPAELKALMQANTARSKQFLKDIRAYNNVLAFASLGAHVDESLSRGRGVYTFRVHGSVYHNIGPLMPGEGQEHVPRFAQLYFFDTEHELENRLLHIPTMNRDILLNLQNMMHHCNPYARAFRSAAATMMHDSNVHEVRMVIRENRCNGWQYLAPRGSEVAAIMPGQGDEANIGHRDVILKLHGGGLRRISTMHRSYMPLLYVLLFPHGEDGWHPHLKTNERNSKHVTQKQYYTYMLQVRNDTTECLLRGGRLLQQYIVDAYSTMEESRLLWLRNNQKILRAEVYQGLADMVGGRDGVDQQIGRNVGRRIVLPSSFTGGPRHMHQLYQDAMAIVRKRGKPDLFITFTCNPRWREIQDALLPGQSASDRPDLTTRVFYQKYKDMMHLILDRASFGKIVGHVSVIEFQKRGLPHAHILLILGSEYKPVETCHFDRLVSAELPNKQFFPELYNVISSCNMHGPCGQLNRSSACMVDGKCRFKYPRKFSATTSIDDTGYPIYMRRDNGSFVQAKDVKLDNRWVVPYNPFLSMRYNAHINVEICSTITAVKYLYKYVYKGHDRATVVMQDGEGSMDEIQSYLDARYVSASEAIWRIYGFDMHEEKPDVQRLQVHLPMQNIVTFGDCDDLIDVVNNEENKKTTLTEWFGTNQTYSEANELLYIDFPTKWVWNRSSRCWTKRQHGDTIGRMYNIVPTAGDLYYLRVLLTKCKGCKSYEDLRTFNGQIYTTFKQACNARGLLQSDEEWYLCLEEASIQQTGLQLRQLLAIILVFCEPLSPGCLWTRFSSELAEDYFHAVQRHGHNVQACHEIATNLALSNLQNLLQTYGKRLLDFPGMPQVDRSRTFLVENTVFAEEMVFDAVEQANMALDMETLLNTGQQNAYYQVLQAIDSSDKGGVFFLDGPGGSGKTYLYNALLCRLRGQQKIALACASSGIAALLLSNGRTAHSRFKIPLELNADSTCNIKVNSGHAELLRLATLIVWDEAPMVHRYAFEALDKTLRDIMQNDTLFGGKTILFGGDFRQVLPVVRKGRREDIVDATLCHSFIWKHIKVLRLTENMRVVNCSTDTHLGNFAKWLLEIGNGEFGDTISLPSSMLLEQNCVHRLIDFIYQDLSSMSNCASFFRERGILAPRNKDVDMINSLAVLKMEGLLEEYLSADSLCISDNQSDYLYTTEFLNSLDLGGGFPPHALRLKVNAPIMLLRNLDPRRGLCNGTRLICKQFYRRVLEAEIITGKHAGDRVFIPRIDFLTSSSLGLPFNMKRRQFPVKLAFAMTINKAQGQTLGILGLYLASPIFSHGQLYVALSRVRSFSTIKVIVDDAQVSKQDTTTSISVTHTPNIVYKEVLRLAGVI